MKRNVWFSLIAALIFLLPGCGGGGAGSQGSAPQKSAGALVFNLDLSDLAAGTVAKSAAAVADPITITSAKVTLTRSGYSTIQTDLTVTNNVATGTVDNLDMGYWHVKVDVYSGQTPIYTGESDANVLAGIEVQVKVYFDPTPVVQTTGSLSFTVGLNPMPGYRPLNQQVSKSLYSEVTGKVYLLDASANIIAVYDAATMNREKDIAIPNPPLSLALNFAKDGLLLGYPSGHIYKLDPASGAMTLLADILTEVYCLAPISEKVLLAAGRGSYDSVFKSIDQQTGQVLNSKSYWYSFNEIAFNPNNGIAYSLSVNVSPQDLHRIQVNPTDGTFVEIKDSPYHGDYTLGQPLRIIKNGSRLATAGGTTFSSSALSSEDLLYRGSLNYSYADMAVDDALGYLYLLNPANSYYQQSANSKLLVINQSNFFLEKTLDLSGQPKTIFQTADNIIILSTKDSAYYVKVIPKSSLGLK